MQAHVTSPILSFTCSWLAGHHLLQLGCCCQVHDVEFHAYAITDADSNGTVATWVAVVSDLNAHTERSTVFETVFGPSPIRGKVRLPIGLQRLQNHCSAGPLLVGKGFAVSSLGDTCNARAASQASWPALTLTTTAVSAGASRFKSASTHDSCSCARFGASSPGIRFWKFRC